MPLEDFGIITSLTPACKWTYPQEYEGGTHTVEAQSGAELVANLLQFRLKAKLPVGDPERDVAEHIKEQSPNNYRFQNKSHLTRAERKPRAKFVPPIERIRATMATQIEAKPRFVSEIEADQRAETCAGCAHNIEWRVRSCPPCNREADYLALVLRQRTSYKHDESLGACRLHDLHLGSAVFLDRDFLPQEPHPEAPADCWVGANPSI